MKTLVMINPEKHMYRWYSIGIQNTLVDGLAVVFGWGSRKVDFSAVAKRVQYDQTP